MSPGARKSQFYVLLFFSGARIVNLHQCELSQDLVARKVEMQLALVFVVLLFSIAIIVYALPVMLYIVPLVVIGVLISIAVDSHHHHGSRPAGH